MIEHDSIGTVETPDDAYYGIYSHRATALRVTPYRAAETLPEFIKSIYFVKKHCALANLEIGALGKEEAEAIAQASAEGMEGTFDKDLIIDMYQGNGDVATIMNINEILAKRANEIITGAKGYERTKPNDHASCNQATTEVLMSSARICAYEYLTRLQATLRACSDAFAKKVEEHGHVIRLGRTELKDALPVTFGQTFGSYRDVLKRLADQANPVKEGLLKLPLGGAAIGSGIGSRPDFGPVAVRLVAEAKGIPFTTPENCFDTVQNCDPMLQVANYQQTVAATMTKIAKDIRIMSSGPHAGFNEVKYPAPVPGSVTLPGKTNPVIEELIMRVNMRVMANSGVALKCIENSELEYNYLETMMDIAVLESFTMMCNAYDLILDVCFSKLEVNKEVTERYANATNALSILLTPVFGYAAATKVGVRCYKENLSVKEVVVQEGLMTQEDADYFLDPMHYTDSKKYFAILSEAKERYQK